MPASKVLIVEDELVSASMVSAILQKTGYSVAGIEAFGEKAINRASELHPDIILMDINLKGEMDGIEAARRIKEQFDIPVIYLTASSDTLTLERAKKSDPFGYILKPVERNNLLVHIEMALVKHDLEKKLKASQRLLSVTLNSIGDAVIATDCNECISFMNPAAAVLTGWSESEAIGRNLNEIFRIIKPDDKFYSVSNKNEYPETVAEAHSKLFQCLLQVARDGTSNAIEFSKSPLQDENASNIGYVVVFRNITERLQAAATLKKMFLQNKQLLSSIPLILISIDSNNLITHWNQFAQKAFGMTESQVLGSNFFNNSISWDWEAIICGIGKCRKRISHNQIPDIKYTNREGKSGFLKITVNPFSSGNSENSGVLIVGEDISERKNLENQLTQSQKLESIGQLAAGMAHEINTPTQYITDNLRFLQESFGEILKINQMYSDYFNASKEEVRLKKQTANLVKAIQKSDIDYLSEEIPVAIAHSLEGIEHVAKIVRGMRDFSHPNVTKKVSVDINNAITSTITVARHEWKNAAEIETEFAEDLPKINCYPGELNQVILNIILNATHAIMDVVGENSEQKGNIKIRTKRYGDGIEIRISDTGTGIPENIRSKIFDPFFTTKDVDKGTGLGLSISHSVIVEKHNGTLTFETETGKGTTFIIRLPIQ